MKPLIRLTIFFGFLIVLWFIGKLTGTFQRFRMPGASMEPTIRTNSGFFVSNLKKPKRNDIIAFRRTLTEKDGYGTPGTRLSFISRLIASGGETLEIKNGYAFINGELVDDSSNLKMNYLMSSADAMKTISTLGIDYNNLQDANEIHKLNDSTEILNLSYEDFKRFRKIATIIQDTSRFLNSGLPEIYGNNNSKNWTIHNYGPIKIPEDCYFVLGDNRNNAGDSRYTGPIPKKDFVGTVLWKK